MRAAKNTVPESSCERPNSVQHRGFTLVELLVTVAIIGILAGLLIPAVMMALESARKTTCQNNLRQIGIALQQHHETYRVFPPGIEWNRKGRMPLSSWAVKLYPYLEQQALFDQAKADYRQGLGVFGPVPHYGVTQALPIFSCPSDGRAETTQLARNQFFVALTNYLGVIGTDYRKKDGILFADSAIRVQDIRDGTSYTVIVGERPPSHDMWFGWLYSGLGIDEGAADVVLGVQERNNGHDILNRCSLSRVWFRETSFEDPCQILQFWSFHPGGAFFLHADGSIRFYDYESRTQLEKAAGRYDRAAS